MNLSNQVEKLDYINHIFLIFKSCPRYYLVKWTEMSRGK